MKTDHEPDRRLEELFRLSRDAILGSRNGRVVLANAAARRFFGEDCSGRRIAELIGETLPISVGESCVFCLHRSGKDYRTSAVREGDLMLVTVPQEELSFPGLAPAVLAQLNTSAYNLRMAAELITRRCSGDAKLADYASILTHNYYSMTRLTRSLSDASALARGELRLNVGTVELTSLIRDLTEGAAHLLRNQGAELRCRLPEETVLLRGDRERLDQLLLCLLTNALQHTGIGGQITLTLSAGDGRILIRMKDDGEGIPDEKLAELFSHSLGEVLTTGGAGLGLYIAQGIARLHGGTLMINSRYGQGTEVYISLPQEPELKLMETEPISAGAHLLLTELSPVLPHEVYSDSYAD